MSTEYIQEEGIQSEKIELLLQNVANVVREGYIWLHLDEFPEEVDTQRESSLAALEATLRSQGIPLFLGEFIFLWLAMSVALRRYKLGMSACAAASAYVLCQFSFFMLFAVLLTWGKSRSLSGVLILFLLSVDYYQLLGVKPGRSVRLAIRTGLLYLLFYGALILVLSGVALLVAWLRG